VLIRSGALQEREWEVEERDWGFAEGIGEGEFEFDELEEQGGSGFEPEETERLQERRLRAVHKRNKLTQTEDSGDVERGEVQSQREPVSRGGNRVAESQKQQVIVKGIEVQRGVKQVVKIVIKFPEGADVTADEPSQRVGGSVQEQWSQDWGWEEAVEGSLRGVAQEQRRAVGPVQEQHCYLRTPTYHQQSQKQYLITQGQKLSTVT
jgi:hypothetical protein